MKALSTRCIQTQTNILWISMLHFCIIYTLKLVCVSILIAFSATFNYHRANWAQAQSP